MGIEDSKDKGPLVNPDIVVRPFPEKDEKIIPVKRKIKIKRGDVEDKRRTTILR
jgi:hypothetical protein